MGIWLLTNIVNLCIVSSTTGMFKCVIHFIWYWSSRMSSLRSVLISEVAMKTLSIEWACVYNRKQTLVEAQSVTTETPPQRSRVSKVTAKRLGSVWRYAAGEHLEQVRKTLASEEAPQDECIFGELPTYQPTEPTRGAFVSCINW